MVALTPLWRPMGELCGVGFVGWIVWGGLFVINYMEWIRLGG